MTVNELLIVVNWHMEFKWVVNGLLIVVNGL